MYNHIWPSDKERKQETGSEKPEEAGAHGQNVVLAVVRQGCDKVNSP
jgi:hypothetical protein